MNVSFMKIVAECLAVSSLRGVFSKYSTVTVEKRQTGQQLLYMVNVMYRCEFLMQANMTAAFEFLVGY